MEARLNPFGTDVGTKFGKYLVAASKTVVDSTLPAATQELVKIRASQINGCAVCLDMHTKDAAHAGETLERLNMIAGLARSDGLHRGGARRPRTHRAGHPHRRRRRRCHRRSLGQRGETLRRRTTHGPRGPDRHHQRLQPGEPHPPTASRLLPTWAAGVTNRRALASPAVASTASVPAVRRRLVGAKPWSKFLVNRRFPSAVAWWTIPSGSASRTAVRTSVGESPGTRRRSQTLGRVDRKGCHQCQGQE